MSRELTADDTHALGEALAAALVEFLSMPENWRHTPPAVRQPADVLMKLAQATARAVAPAFAPAGASPEQVAAVAHAAALHACKRVRPRFGGYSAWVDTPPSARRQRAEAVIAAAMAAGRPISEAFSEAGVSRATGYRIRDRLLSARRP
jgi:uncharacterized protein (DUF1800 family)